MRLSSLQNRFFWQGLLMLLPALLLAGMGALALRQDRLLADHQARELAATQSLQLHQSLLGELSKGLPTARYSTRAALAGQGDPLLQSQEPPAQLGFLNEEGDWTYPPRKASWPRPTELDPGTLTEFGLREWTALQGATNLLDEGLLRRFLATQPPPTVAAEAMSRWAALLQQAGRETEYRLVLEKMLEQVGELPSPSGVPYRILVLWQLLDGPWQRTGSLRAEELVNLACLEAIYRPTPFSPLLLKTVQEKSVQWLPRPPDRTRERSRAWNELWRRHEETRGFLARLTPALTNGPASCFWWTEGGRQWLVCSRTNGEGRWIGARPEAVIQSMTTRLLQKQSLPAYLGVTVKLGQRMIRELPGPHTLLAERSAEGVEVRVFLTQPERLYAQQQQRTWIFGSLIGLAVAVVVAGFVATRRAFARQEQLQVNKSNFVASVSHELRAPIASVRLMAEELDHLTDPEKRREYQRCMVLECRRISALIENVLDFSRHEQGRKQYQFEECDLGAVIGETIRLLQPYAAGKSVTLLFPEPGEEFPAEVDGQALQQVLVNLLDNAIKHSPAGATVEVGLEAGSGTIHLWVQDQGPGIPESEQERIFERFYRRGSELRRETQGVGLGLAIVKYVVEAHHGRIGVVSRPGEGSRFLLELPCRRPLSR